jgi:uncharacterized membrane protein
MINSIDGYLKSLKDALKGCDSATIQDALSDAEEHLRTAIEKGLEESDKVVEADILSNIIEKYGSPDEIASAYRDIEDRIRPAFARTPVSSNKSILSRFFGIFADAGAWGSLIYMIFALVTGIIYRMPRRTRFTDKNVKLWDRIKDLLTDRSTWSGILYLIFQLPLGIIYFSLMIILIATSIACIFAPMVQVLMNVSLIHFGSEMYYAPLWVLPLITIGGILLLTITMHIAKFVGKIHGKYAKAVLVSE